MTNDELSCDGSAFQMAGAATWKLRVMVTADEKRVLQGG